MSAFAVTADGRVLARFDGAETDVLLSLSQQFAELVGGADDPSLVADPAIRRLFPDAYRDDREASAEFSRYTRTDLAAAKIAAASTVQDALGGGDLLLDAETGWSWLRHLTDLRLTVAARLGVVDDPDAFEEAPDPDVLSEEDILARGVFDWLGYTQELLIAALEEAASTDAGTGNGATGPSSAPA